MNAYLHLLVQKHDNYWSARCLDFTLYAVGDTVQEAREKLDAQIEDYLYDAIEGIDKDYAAQLLLRRAPWQEWVKYYLVVFLQHFRIVSENLGEAIKSSIPQGPFRHA